jgi:hypothetical protein
MTVPLRAAGRPAAVSSATAMGHKATLANRAMRVANESICSFMLVSPELHELAVINPGARR